MHFSIGATSPPKGQKLVLVRRWEMVLLILCIELDTHKQISSISVVIKFHERTIRKRKV